MSKSKSKASSEQPKADARNREKVQYMFNCIDKDRDGRLTKGELINLLVLVNPHVQFKDGQLEAIADEVFKTYSEFLTVVNGRPGLTVEGLIQSYDDGAGDLSRDYALVRKKYKHIHKTVSSAGDKGISGKILGKALAGSSPTTPQPIEQIPAVPSSSPARPMPPGAEEKIKFIFEYFDADKDGRLNKDEVLALLCAINPSLPAGSRGIGQTIDKLWRVYYKYIDEKGLTIEGLWKVYHYGGNRLDVDYDLVLQYIDQCRYQVPAVQEVPYPYGTPPPEYLQSYPSIGAMSVSSYHTAISHPEMVLPSPQVAHVIPTQHLDTGRFTRMEKMQVIFSCFDQDQDGFLGKAELQHLLRVIDPVSSVSRHTISGQQLEQSIQAALHVLAPHITPRGLAFEGFAYCYDMGKGSLDKDFEEVVNTYLGGNISLIKRNPNGSLALPIHFPGRYTSAAGPTAMPYSPGFTYPLPPASPLYPPPLPMPAPAHVHPSGSPPRMPLTPPIPPAVPVVVSTSGYQGPGAPIPGPSGPVMASNGPPTAPGIAWDAAPDRVLQVASTFTPGFVAEEKVKFIFNAFDKNGDGYLSKTEMKDLLSTLTTDIELGEDSLDAATNQVATRYCNFICPGKGLSLEGLQRIYQDRTSDVNLDFDRLWSSFRNNAKSAADKVPQEGKPKQKEEHREHEDKQLVVFQRPPSPRRAPLVPKEAPKPMHSPSQVKPLAPAAPRVAPAPPKPPPASNPPPLQTPVFAHPPPQESIPDIVIQRGFTDLPDSVSVVGMSTSRQRQQENPVLHFTEPEKIRIMFNFFDTNDDGALNTDEIRELMATLNPGKFNKDILNVAAKKVLQTYSAFTTGNGLSLAGLMKAYEDGVGNVEEDFGLVWNALARRGTTTSIQESIISHRSSASVKPSRHASDKDNTEQKEKERRAQEQRRAEQLEQERQEMERMEQARREQERMERAEKERQERDKMEQARKERERVERAEKERLERERMEKERVERERVEQARLERERVEQARREHERMDWLEKERQERERMEQARLELERMEWLEKERQERERVEQARLERERMEWLEQERQERERVEQSRLERERMEWLEQERQERERVEQARLERERMEWLEKERQERERVEQARLERERMEWLEKERKERERVEQARLERERMEWLEQERQERERMEQARLEQERSQWLEQERLERERLEQSRLEQEKMEWLAIERKEREVLEQLDRERRDWLEQQRQQRDRLAWVERERGREEAEKERLVVMEPGELMRRGDKDRDERVSEEHLSDKLPLRPSAKDSLPPRSYSADSTGPNPLTLTGPARSWTIEEGQLGSPQLHKSMRLGPKLPVTVVVEEEDSGVLSEREERIPSVEIIEQEDTYSPKMPAVPQGTGAVSVKALELSVASMTTSSQLEEPVKEIVEGGSTSPMPASIDAESVPALADAKLPSNTLAQREKLEKARAVASREHEEFMRRALRLEADLNVGLVKNGDRVRELMDIYSAEELLHRHTEGQLAINEHIILDPSSPSDLLIAKRQELSLARSRAEHDLDRYIANTKATCQHALKACDEAERTAALITRLQADACQLTVQESASSMKSTFRYAAGLPDPTLRFAMEQAAADQILAAEMAAEQSKLERVTQERMVAEMVIKIKQTIEYALHDCAAAEKLKVEHSQAIEEYDQISIIHDSLDQTLNAAESAGKARSATEKAHGSHAAMELALKGAVQAAKANSRLLSLERIAKERVLAEAPDVEMKQPSEKKIHFGNIIREGSDEPRSFSRSDDTSEIMTPTSHLPTDITICSAAQSPLDMPAQHSEVSVPGSPQLEEGYIPMVIVPKVAVGYGETDRPISGPASLSLGFPPTSQGHKSLGAREQWMCYSSGKEFSSGGPRQRRSSLGLRSSLTGVPMRMGMIPEVPTDRPYRRVSNQLGASLTRLGGESYDSSALPNVPGIGGGLLSVGMPEVSRPWGGRRSSSVTGHSWWAQGVGLERPSDNEIPLGAKEQWSGAAPTTAVTPVTVSCAAVQTSPRTSACTQTENLAPSPPVNLRPQGRYAMRTESVQDMEQYVDRIGRLIKEMRVINTSLGKNQHTDSLRSMTDQLANLMQTADRSETTEDLAMLETNIQSQHAALVQAYGQLKAAEPKQLLSSIPEEELPGRESAGLPASRPASQEGGSSEQGSSTGCTPPVEPTNASSIEPAQEVSLPTSTSTFESDTAVQSSSQTGEPAPTGVAENTTAVPAYIPPVSLDIPALTRPEKVHLLFHVFDQDQDGALNAQELKQYVNLVNGQDFSTPLSEQELDEAVAVVFSCYPQFVVNGGLTLGGLEATYVAGAGDIDRDLDAVWSKAGLNETWEDHMPGYGTYGKGSSTCWALLGQLLDHLDERYPHGELDQVAPQVQAAVTKVRDAAAILPKDDLHQLYVTLGWHLARRGGYGEAIRCYRDALQMNAEDPLAWFRLGNVLFATTYYVDARCAYLTTLELAQSPSLQWLVPKLYLNLGMTLDMEGLYMTACTYYNDAAKLLPNSARAAKVLGSALLGVRWYREAKEALMKAVQLEPTYVDALCDLALVHVQLKDYPAAERAFLEALTHDPEHIPANFNLGNMYRQTERWQEAVQTYDRCLSLEPDHWRPLLCKGAALWGGFNRRKDGKAMMRSALGAGGPSEMGPMIQSLKGLNKSELTVFMKLMSADDQRHNKVLLQRILGAKKSYSGPISALSSKEMASINQEGKWKAKELDSKLDVDLLIELTTFAKSVAIEAVEAQASFEGIPEEDRKLPAGPEGPITVMKRAGAEGIVQDLLQQTAMEAAPTLMKVLVKEVMSVMDQDMTGYIDVAFLLCALATLCNAPLVRRMNAIWMCLVWRRGGGQVRQEDAEALGKVLKAMFSRKDVNHLAGGSSFGPSNTDVSGAFSPPIDISQLLKVLTSEEVGLPYLAALPAIAVTCTHDGVLYATRTC